MEAAKILQSSALDILFDNRNKMYGAYILRKDYWKRLSISIISTTLVVGVFSFFVTHKTKNDIATIKPPETNPVMVKLRPVDNVIKKPEIKIPVAKKAEEPPKIKMTQLTKPVVAPDNQVTVAPPKQDANLTIGPITQDGKDVHGLMTAPPKEKGIGGNNLRGGSPGGGGESGDFIPVQVEAKFPGGEEAWRIYLHNNLRQDVPLNNGASAGQYAVTVSFVVSKDGTISDVKVVDAPSPDFGTSAEAIRVIQRGPKWLPAIQNGRPVTYRQKQRIIFQVQEQ